MEYILEEKMRTVILGGGISGLSAAWFYHKKFPEHKIILLEKQKRLGGWIETKVEEGFSFERGPRTLPYSRSPKILELIQELGLSSHIVSSLASANKRFLWKGKKFCSPLSFWPSLLYGVLREAFWVAPLKIEDESIDSFARRRFGPKIASTFFDPMTLGIYAGDAKKLSIRSCFPPFWLAEQKGSSVVRSLLKKKRGRGGLFTLQGGLSSLIEKMSEILPIEIVTDCEVGEIGSNHVATSRGVFLADRMISALPAYEVSRLTQIDLSIPYRSIWVVHLGFSSRVLSKKGFGYLVPTEEGENLLGMVWDSEIFGSEKTTRLTAMIREKSLDPIQEALDALGLHLNILQKPDYVSSHLAKSAIPQFEVGHDAKMAHFEKEAAKKFPHLFLAGNYLAGASLESCVARSQSIIDRLSCQPVT